MKRTLKEKFLYSRLKKRDQEAFAEIYDLFVEPLYRFIYFKVGNKSEAEDLTSEVFLKAWSSAQESGQLAVKTLPAFLYRIARNTVVDYYRRKKQNLSLDETVETSEEPLSREDLAADFDLAVDREALLKALDQLKDEYREIIVMRYIEDLSTSEIASILEKNKGAVRVSQHRALEALKKILATDKQ
jgi:RNA polymerase sigma-70 factor (ECF subfamily)